MEAERSLRDAESPWRVNLDGGEDFSPEEFEAARDWRMLLQVDADRRMKWGWGDGQVYVLIRREDAKRLDFSKTISICQFG